MEYSYYFLGSYLAYKTVSWIFGRINAYNIKQQAARKRQLRDGQPLPDLPEVPEEIMQEIIELNGSDLVDAIKRRRFSCEQVMAVYIRRAYEFGRKYRISAEELFEEAIEQARQHDRQLAERPQSCGILFGLPVSVKDSYRQHGCCTTAGLARLAFVEDEVEAVSVQALKRAGAIPFIRGNVPQMMLWVETQNQTYGTANNPWDETRTVGGSSGGDGGLVGARACIFALCGDLAGSIRIPPIFNGVYGFAPTARRTSGKDCIQGHPEGVIEWEGLLNVSYGPIARSTDDLILALRALTNDFIQKLDSQVVPLPFDVDFYEHTYHRPLRIGYVSNYKLFKLSAACQRAQDEVLARLQELGHTMVPFDIPNQAKLLELFLSATNNNQKKIQKEILGGEDPEWFYSKVHALAGVPFNSQIVRQVLKATNQLKLLSIVENAKQDYDTKTYGEIYQQLQKARYDLSRMWGLLELDALISIPCITPAVKHGQSEQMFPSCTMIFLLPILQLPSGVLPVTTVQEGEDTYESSGDLADNTIRDAFQGSVGLPISIQVSALPYQDEKALAVMKIIEEQFPFYRHPVQQDIVNNMQRRYKLIGQRQAPIKPIARPENVAVFPKQPFMAKVWKHGKYYQNSGIQNTWIPRSRGGTAKFQKQSSQPVISPNTETESFSLDNHSSSRINYSNCDFNPITHTVIRPRPATASYNRQKGLAVEAGIVQPVKKHFSQSYQKALESNPRIFHRRKGEFSNYSDNSIKYLKEPPFKAPFSLLREKLIL